MTRKKKTSSRSSSTTSSRKSEPTSRATTAEEATAPSSADVDKGGRPAIYQDAFVLVAEQLCKLGATDHELAQAFGVAESSIRRWRCEHQAFAEACKVGKAAADDRVEQALYSRACGYTHASEKIFCTKFGDIVRAPYTKHYAPETAAAFIWLKNRRPDQWRDKLEISDTRPLDVTSEPLSADEWNAKHGAH